MNISDNKRPATTEETHKALVETRKVWNMCNPNFELSIVDIEDKQAQAEADGYISEVCGECGCVFLAFHHFTRCRSETCPMKDDGSGKSVLEHIFDDIEQTDDH